jgi:hypothetical protein
MKCLVPKLVGTASLDDIHLTLLCLVLTVNQAKVLMGKKVEHLAMSALRAKRVGLLREKNVNHACQEHIKMPR